MTTTEALEIVLDLATAAAHNEKQYAAVARVWVLIEILERGTE
jgi:hypothetical protein